MDTRTCPGCGVQFVPAKARQRYCSVGCAARAAGRSRWERTPRKATVQVCARCGKEFLAYNYKESHERFCSRSCRKLGQAVACVVCGRILYHKRAQLNRARPVCSAGCAGRLGLAGRYDSDGFPRLRKNERAFRNFILGQRGRRCELCGSTEGLQIHHEQHVSKRPDLEFDPSNVMLLCQGCHATRHGDESVAALIRSHWNSAAGSQ